MKTSTVQEFYAKADMRRLYVLDHDSPTYAFLWANVKVQSFNRVLTLVELRASLDQSPYAITHVSQEDSRFGHSFTVQADSEDEWKVIDANS